MMAVAVALATIMWMWAAAAVHITRILGRADGHRGQRLAYYAALLAVGLTVLAYALWWVLPASVLSQGWTLKQLQSVQQGSALLLACVSLLAFWRAARIFAPLHSPVPVSVPGKHRQKKRRP